VIIVLRRLGHRRGHDLQRRGRGGGRGAAAAGPAWRDIVEFLLGPGAGRDRGEAAPPRHRELEKQCGSDEEPERKNPTIQP